MATVVPVSHSQHWRSRSRNHSADAMTITDLHIHVPVTDDDDDIEYDDAQSSPWLVVPQGFVSPVQQRSSANHPVSPIHAPLSWQKAMEMRRASGF